jgi:hypothetical protein
MKRKKAIPAKRWNGRKNGIQKRLLGSVATDGLDWATSQSFFAKSSFLIALRLFVEVRMAAVIITLEVRRGCLAAEIAVDALIIHIVCAFDVVRVFVCCVCHILRFPWFLRGLGLRK